MPFYPKTAFILGLTKNQQAETREVPLIKKAE
jgi:hypothetical protein